MKYIKKYAHKIGFRTFSIKILEEKNNFYLASQIRVLNLEFICHIIMSL